MRYIIHALVGCVLAAWLLTSSAALAQETQVEPPVVTQEKTEQQPETIETPASVETPDIDLDDPALREALDAREKADRAIADAVEAQRKAAGDQTQTVTETVAEGAEKAKSIIPKSMDEVKAIAGKVWAKIVGWLTSVPFLAQVGAIILAYFLAPIIAAVLRKRIFLFQSAPAEGVKLKPTRDYIFRGRNLLRPILLVALLALFALVLKNVPAVGQDWLVKLVQGLAVVFLLFTAIKEFAPSDLVRKLATWVLIPLALLMVFGYFDKFIGKLEATVLVDSMNISAMTLVKLVIFGALFFWLGGVSNHKGQTAIRKQEALDVSTREVVAKIFQIILFAVLFILLLSFAGIPLSGLVVIFSALTLGIGLGLQPVAANFVSGLIILFDRTVQVGDFIELSDGQQGFVEAINMRSTTVETTDGKDIMVPNTRFIEDAYQNWTHKDPRQRYEVYFSVSYDTDIDKLEDILIPAVLSHHQVLKEPEMPDLELREFGDFGIKFAIEFWCDGVDDGPNKFTSDLNFIVWRTLKEHGIKMPLPQREVKLLK